MSWKPTRFNHTREASLARSHQPNLWVVECSHFLCAAGFLFGLYRIATDPASAVGYLVLAVFILLYSRIVMGYRYWRLVECVHRQEIANNQGDEALLLAHSGLRPAMWHPAK